MNFLALHWLRLLYFLRLIFVSKAKAVDGCCLIIVRVLGKGIFFALWQAPRIACKQQVLCPSVFLWMRGNLLGPDLYSGKWVVSEVNTSSQVNWQANVKVLLIYKGTLKVCKTWFLKCLICLKFHVILFLALKLPYTSKRLPAPTPKSKFLYWKGSFYLNK